MSIILNLGYGENFSDGSFGGRTALLSEPYEDAEETNGVAIFSREELAELVKKAQRFTYASCDSYYR